MAYRRALVLLAVLLAACSAEPRTTTAPAEVVPAVVIPETTTTTEPPPPTTTTTEPEAVEAPVTTVPRVRATTTVPRATAATLAPRPSTGSGACGGDLPPCYVMGRESGGDPSIIGYGQCGTKANPRDCQGKWQIDPDTAESAGYPRNLADQPEHVQDDAARAILARDGCDAWSTC